MAPKLSLKVASDVNSLLLLFLFKHVSPPHSAAVANISLLLGGSVWVEVGQPGQVQVIPCYIDALTQGVVVTINC